MVKYKRILQSTKWIICVIATFQVINCDDDNNGFCNINTKEDCSEDIQRNRRYIFYDVNPPEGFNLRRDVYMRYAVFAKYLSDNVELFGDIKLVLPPWSFLFHWEHAVTPGHIPWGYFFDLKSLQNFAPVIEMYQFFEEIKPSFKKVKIDEVYVLQHYNDMFAINKFEDKLSIEECNERPNIQFFYYKNLTSDSIKCVSFHGFTSQLEKVLNNSTAKTILFDHAEVALHDYFGGKIYWQCRRSMRFNSALIKFAEQFRNDFLNSSNQQDNVIIPVDWRDEKPNTSARGGPYLAVHLRRRDFVRARSTEVPSLQNSTEQIIKELQKQRLTTIFLSTDAPSEEYNQILTLLREQNYRAIKYEPTAEEMQRYKEGGVAIIDQIICAHAQLFVGSYESTFSFRIQEEREIMGLPSETTFNRFCGDNTRKCSPPSVWKIVY